MWDRMSRYDESEAVPPDIESVPVHAGPQGVRTAGCLILIMLLTPCLIFGISRYLHLLELTGLGLIIWIVVANLKRRRIFDPNVVMLGGPITVLLIGLGLLMPLIPWLPCPAWIPRTTVKRSDYRTMETIFGKSLPDSFHITHTRYPGYDLVFNGPDGPLPAGYEIMVNAHDLSHLVQGFNLEEIKSQQGEWPGRQYETLFLLKDLHNDLAEQYWAGKLEYQTLKDKLKVFMLEKHKDTIWISIDERTSPSLKVYLSTRVPYMENPS